MLNGAQNRKSFIRIGSQHINTNKIVEIDTDYEAIGGGHTVHIVLQSLDIDGAYGTDALASFSTAIDFVHGTPEAQAIIAWLEGQSVDLLDPTPQFYVTSNLYGGHVAYLAEAALANNAELLAVDGTAIKDLGVLQCGSRAGRADFLFLVSAPTLQDARDTVERIQAVAGEMEE